MSDVEQDNPSFQGCTLCGMRMGKDIAKFHPEMVEAEKRRMAEEPPPEPETFGGVLHKLGEWYDKSHWHKLLFWLLLLFSLYAFSHHFWLQPCESDMVFGGCESYE